jgi:transposase
MGLIRLAKKAREGLTRISRSRSDKRRARRAKALLGLHHGKSVQQVALDTGLSRQAIYNLQKRYLDRQAARVHQRVSDGAHTGRPPKKRQLVMQIVGKLIKRNPRRYGYDSTAWTIPMLNQEVQKQTGVEVSHRTIRRALRALHLR